MSHLLTSGQVGNIGLNHMKAVRQETQAKWESLGFLEGLRGHVKENIAQLYENQASALLTESTTATNSGSFETVVFPIVRRVFSKLLANDIVSVQAMNMPIGKLFYFVPQTSSRVSSAGVAGDNYTANQPGSDVYLNPAIYSAHTGLNGLNNGTATGAALPSCVVPAAGTCAITQNMAKNLYDLFYDDGLFDNSKGTLTIRTMANVPVFSGTGNGGYNLVPAGGTNTAVVAPAAADGSIRQIVVAVSGFTGGASNKAVLTGPDGNPMDTESFLASLQVVTPTNILDRDGNVVVAANRAIPFRVVTQQYGQGIVQYNNLTDASGYIYLGLDVTHPVGTTAGSGAAAAGTATFDGYVGASATTIGAYSALTAAWAEYASLELETEMGEVTFTLTDVVVSVEERKLRATWSPELAQDVSAFHNIDAEAELTAMLSEQIAAEIDREILRDLRKVAAWQLRWDYNGWRRATGTNAAPYTQKDWNQTLITKVNQISAQIHKSTLRGGANYIVVSSEVSAVFDDLEYFHVSDANPEQDQYNMGIERIGTLGGRYQVYRDPYSPAYSIIIGHKGKSLLDTGYIYAPYVPLQLTPTMYNPFNFAPVKGIMTRYAKKSVNNRFYGHVRVDGIPTFNVAELR